MEKTIQLKFFEKININILKFLNESKATKRSYNSFIKNKIIFVIATHGKKIIGCIPLEPRVVLLGKKKIKVLFITNAFIKKDSQNSNIGTKLLKYIKKKTKKPLLAFRALQNDQASQWYKKNYFYSLLKLVSYEKKLKKKCYLDSFFKKITFNKENKLNLLKNISSNSKSFIKRTTMFTENIYFNNYYSNYLKDSCIYIYKKSKQFNYLQIVKTNMGDNKIRVEIMDNNLSINQLRLFIENFSQENFNGIKNLRIKVIDNKENKNLFKKMGFIKLNYFSNLLCDDCRFKKIKHIQFNAIEYV